MKPKTLLEEEIRHVKDALDLAQGSARQTVQNRLAHLEQELAEVQFDSSLVKVVRLVTFKVDIMIEPGADPDDILQQASVQADLENGAIINSEVVEIKNRF